MKDTLIIVPAFNEEQNIGNVIRSLSQIPAPVDVVVINDGSSDGTFKAAKEAGAKVVSHPTNLGYLAAIQTGFQYAEKQGYETIVFFDGDGQHDPLGVITVREAIMEGKADVVIGSRFIHESSMRIGWMKWLAVVFFRQLIYWITGQRITDPTSGFRAFRRKAYKRYALSSNFYYDLPDSNFIIDILLQKLTITEVPVNMYDREHGKSKIHQTGIKPMIYMVQTLLSILIVILKNKIQLSGGKAS